MIQFDFGRLEQVELRTVWVSEESDFASWISRSDSLAMLGEALNLELELENMEGWVTPSPARRCLPDKGSRRLRRDCKSA